MAVKKHMTSGGALVLVPHPVVDDPRAPRERARLVDPGQPLVRVDDLGVIRGVGAFEVVHGVDGKVIAAQAHLERLVRSCERLGLPAPDLTEWRAAMDLAIRAHDPTGEFALRLVLTGGDGSPESMCGWVRYETIAAGVIDRRQKQLTATLLDRGVAAGASHDAPWLLIGAKTLSYGPNLAAGREANRRGFDEAIYVSTDGYLLEAPTSSVVVLTGDTLITPDPSLGILPGTTQELLFAHADKLGLGAHTGKILAAETDRIDGMWLTAGMRLVTPIANVDGTKIPVDLDLTARMNQLLLGLAEPVL